MIIFRIIQGVGGALLTPQTLSVITMIFPPDKRGAAFGIWGAVAGVATVAGPTLGGWLVTDYGWRWIFFVNVPIGIIALVLAAIVMPNIKLNRRHRLDVPGVAAVHGGAVPDHVRPDRGPVPRLGQGLGSDHDPDAHRRRRACCSRCSCGMQYMRARRRAARAVQHLQGPQLRD